MGFVKALAAPFAALMLVVGPAGALTYDVNLMLTDQTTLFTRDANGSSFTVPTAVAMTVTGSVTTDGTLGSLSALNVTGWNLTIVDWVGRTSKIAEQYSYFFGSLFATSGELYSGPAIFNFRMDLVPGQSSTQVGFLEDCRATGVLQFPR